jgi:succinate dehydrogenase / fumarate reductase, cytochrome b subunit
MQWINFYTSSIGRKVVMASTGIFLMVFLVFHLGLNATILVGDCLTCAKGDRGVLFNQIANEFHHNWGLRLLELLVFSGFAIHISQGLLLAWQNKSKRNIAYLVKPRFSLNPARSMTLLGIIILAFLLLHLYQFWLPHILGNTTRDLSSNGLDDDDLYELVQETMSQGWVVTIYVAGCLAVAAHLWHGWRSAAITFGISEQYQRLLSVIGISFACAVPLGLAAISIILFAPQAFT